MTTHNHDQGHGPGSEEDGQETAGESGHASTGQVRRAAIAAAATAVIVILGVVLFLAGPTGDHTVSSNGGNPHSTITVTSLDRQPTPSDEATSPTANPSPVQSPSTSTRKPPFRWQGKITLNGPNSDMDLDAIPPRINEQDADIYGTFLEPQIAADSDNVLMSIIPRSGRIPGYAKCRDAVSQSGISRTGDLEPGDVVCLRTSQGRIARLKVTRGVQTSTNPIVSMAVTIWEAS